MILESDRELLKELYLQRLSYEEFSSRSSIKEDSDVLSLIIEEKNSQLLEYVLVYYYHRGYDENQCLQLQQLIIEDWHREHSEIARIFQLKVSCSSSINSIIESIEKRFDYLFEQDDYYPYVRKCVNAIRVLKNDTAREALENLKETTSDKEIRKLVEGQLTKF